VYLFVSSALCTVLPCSARESSASLLAHMDFDFDEEGIGPCCYPFL
jgi:hypothetical protein